MAQLVFLLQIETTINGVRYQKMLEDKLKIHTTIHECNMFMQDGAPRHRSKLESDFFKKISLNWPGNSPDLNPIENLWAILKDKVADEHLTSVKDLEVAIKRIWTQRLQLNTANIKCKACLVVCNLLSKTKVKIVCTRFLHKTG